jgi:hypothetical protein
MAIVVAVAAFGIINLIHAYHSPGVALAMFPLCCSIQGDGFLWRWSSRLP